MMHVASVWVLAASALESIIQHRVFGGWTSQNARPESPDAAAWRDCILELEVRHQAGMAGLVRAAAAED